MRVLCLLLLLSGALAAATVTTAELEVQLVDGVVTRLTNKLTGESCEGPRAELHGLWRKDGPSRFTFDAAADSDYGTVATAIAADGEAVELRHSAEAGPGLRGVQWGLVVPDRFALLVPGQSGQRYDASAPIRAIDLDYPAHWECQFIIIETPRGGFLIQASDVAEHYKALHLRRVGEHWQIGFETQSLAPWEQRRQVPEAVWRLTAFQGPWTAGAALYREWASRAFGFVPLERQRPEWVDDIQFFHIGGLQPALLKALAARVEPRQTMLYVPDWRRDPYDRNYPDYTPAAGVVEGIKAARAMGYRVMLHVNYFGCTEENPAYQQLRAYHVRDPYHDRPHYWLWERVTPAIKFAYINPAAQAWRALFVKAMVEAVRATGCDALHLDQTLCIYNDANGLVDGLNMMQGNLALHRELRAALPEVALSGEGLNEITTPHEAFAQRHLAGLQHADREWNPARIALAHPIASAVLRPQTAIYGYLGYTSPLDHDYFLAWQTGYERFGVLPTLKGVGLADFDDALVQQVLREAALYQRQRPRPRFADYGPETLFAWDLADGRRLEYRREPTGTVLAAGDEVISRRISGVATAAVAGTVVEAVARSEQGFFGLDPSRSYPWRPEAPRPEDARVVEADPPQVLAGRLKAGELSVLELTDPSIEVALWHP
ncbi:MAG: hypothetical protein HUU35_08930, partial [Armatimonadetes bacterium]|nr:hypothetical protein [Armatimonadota bacterium]